MNISLDYDDTYTRDPTGWNTVVNLFKARGHKVYVVTMRYDIPSESTEVINALQGIVDGIYFTGRQQKRNHMFAQGIRIDVWIDDMPDYIV